MGVKRSGGLRRRTPLKRTGIRRQPNRPSWRTQPDNTPIHPIYVSKHSDVHHPDCVCDDCWWTVKKRPKGDRRTKPTRSSNRKLFSPTTRAAIFERDRWSCQAHALGFALDVPCGGQLQAHHVVLRSQGGAHTVENGLSVCQIHHQHAHDVDRAGAEAAGIIQRSTGDT